MNTFTTVLEYVGYTFATVVGLVLILVVAYTFARVIAAGVSKSWHQYKSGDQHGKNEQPPKRRRSEFPR